MSLDQFIMLADNIVEFKADLNDKNVPINSIHIVNLHKRELEATWGRVKENFEKYLFDKNNAEEEEENPIHIETIKHKYKSTYYTYCHCIAKLSEILENLNLELKDNKASTSVNSPANKVSSLDPPSFNHKIHLPPCDVEIFNGSYKAWPTFRDLFTALYINNSHLSPVEKLFHLNQKTSGEAREIVRKSPLTNDGFETAWSNLQDRFENRRILVNGQLKILFSLSNVTSESGKAIQQLQRDINSCISILRWHKINVESWDPIFVFLCSNRLPESTLTLWEHDIADKSALPTWSDLDSFLSNRYRTLESVSEIRNHMHSKQSDSKPKTSNNSSKNINTFQNNVSLPKCPLCPKEFHIIPKCQKFLKMDVSKRFTEIKKLGLCINCFSKAHVLKHCKSKHNCFQCSKRHNTLLHKEVKQYTNTSQPSISCSVSNFYPNTTPYAFNSHSTPIQSTSYSNRAVVESCFAVKSGGVLLGTAAVNICHLGIKYQVRALIDSGSEGSFISERLYNRLRLPSKRINAQISGLNNAVSANVHTECSFGISPIFHSDVLLRATALVVPRLSNNLPSINLDISQFTDMPDIQLADPNFHSSSKIDLLIGGDLFPFIMLSGIKHKICGSLVAQETIFGWILTGPLSKFSPPNSTFVSYFCEISLDKQISRFWEVEDLPKENVLSHSDEFCEDVFRKTTKRDENGRYVVSLPFKEENSTKLLGDSRKSAMAQFLRNEIRLSKNLQLKGEYDKVVQEYIDLNHMCEVSPSVSTINYYLPHHAVIKPESTTTKVRVVFNASSPSSNGNSLNDILHTGPILQSDLTLLILKWRFYKYVFNADIEKMYRQILVNPEQTKFQRILHRDASNGLIRDYELKTVTFGINCAPYLAIRTILQLAEDIATTHPIASNILYNSMYVDDVLTGAHSTKEALEAINELILALKTAGFSLRKWTANSKEILSEIPAEYWLSEDFLEFDECSSAKTLGVRWNALSDVFYFTPKSFSESIFTKREVLSQIAKLFDPAGWLAPCVIMAKIIMQRIWIDGTKWDEILSPETLQQWKTFQNNYSKIKNIQIPRWVGYVPISEVQFHGFCDASEKAYAAALYIRITNGDNITCHLLASKTKVAPIKTLTIPRLELCGAVLLAEMIHNLVPKLEVKSYSVFCWTDSNIVLSWLAKPPCTWLTFVANRISKIVQVTDSSWWNHVRSEHNPADLASRGAYPEDIALNNLWWCGPEWLGKPESVWPQCTTPPEVDIEKKNIKAHFSYFKIHDDILERFSSFSRALRVVAYIYRFFFRTHPKFKSNFRNHNIALTNSEIQGVQTKLISMCQKSNFSNEYRQLETKKNVSLSSSIANLNPFLDSEGIIRSCGRLEKSLSLSYNEKYPIILPYNCPYTRLIVRFVHDISLHGGNQLVLQLLRTQYWIPRVKNLIKNVIRKCKICTIYKKRCQKQLMAALPSERCEISRPFTHTGLDFAGPFDIKAYSGRTCRFTKGYVCIFVCFSTKAIHLEATSDLSTSAFLAAFSRFVSRRGCPLHLYSDNGTTFVGASKVLTREFLQVSNQLIISNYAYQNLTWHFIPPGAPHMGGLWEAGVKSFKTHFRKVSGTFKYTFEEFSTLLSRVEACLNSRPLSSLSQDPTDISALTPGHFLIGSAILTPVDPHINEKPTSIVNRWQRVKLLNQEFCLRWKNEYLKELQKRTKWKIAKENVKESDLVVIKDDNLPPNCWRLGRVVKVHQGTDGYVRVVDVYTQKGKITRPITKIICLPSA